MKKQRFTAITLDREDLEKAGYDESKISDETMKRIAEQYGLLYIMSSNSSYIDYIKNIAEKFNLPKIIKL